VGRVKAVERAKAVQRVKAEGKVKAAEREVHLIITNKFKRKMLNRRLIKNWRKKKKKGKSLKKLLILSILIYDRQKILKKLMMELILRIAKRTKKSYLKTMMRR
jgi:hypothetical protein